MENFRNRVKQLRESKNITQKELSELLGMKTYTTLSIYSHVTDKMSKNIVEKLNKIDL